jgi:hypothetical protein
VAAVLWTSGRKAGEDRPNRCPWFDDLGNPPFWVPLVRYPRLETSLLIIISRTTSTSLSRIVKKTLLAAAFVPSEIDGSCSSL